jgi:hypothetical protein
MDVSPPVARKTVGGALDIWFRGWKVHYPPGGAEPVLTEDPPPDDAKEIQGLTWAASELKHGGWLVMFEGDSAPQAIKIKKPRDRPEHFYRVFDSRER